jgi:predicted acylesterase/phospholipase RssA
MDTMGSRLDPRWAARALRWTWVVWGLSALLGCALPRRDAPPALFSAAAPVDFSVEVRFLSTDRASVEAKSAAALRRLKASSKNGRLQALVLSGGGAGGAFGAGALIGLSRRHERPQYDVVTGVSTGALIAPYAFLGSEWDPQLSEAFTSGQAEPISVRGLLTLPLGASRRSAALAALVDHYVTRDLIEAVAREARRGRLLWVATTDLDREETVIWDLGAIAMRGGEPARTLFRDVVVASASIPGVFKPVLIHVQQGGRLYDEMHVDGSASTSLFIAPAAAYFALLDQHSLEGAQVYVLINGQIIDAPATTPFKLRPIVARTFSVALKHMSRAEVVAVNQFAEKYRMAVRTTYLPFDYPRYSLTDFRASTMRPLFEYGAQCAQDARLWTTLDETMAAGAADAAPPPSKEPSRSIQEVQCPLRTAHFTAADRR